LSPPRQQFRSERDKLVPHKMPPKSLPSVEMLGYFHEVGKSRLKRAHFLMGFVIVACQFIGGQI